MNIENPTIKIKKTNQGKLVFIDNKTGKILSNDETEKHLVEAFFNYCIEEEENEPENLLSKKSQEIIRNNIIKYKMDLIKEEKEKEEWEKMFKNKNNFEIMFFLFFSHIVEIALLFGLYNF